VTTTAFSRQDICVSAPEALIGRGAEQEQLDELLIGLPTSGRAAIFVGDAGIGKTALQAYGEAQALKLGYQVLRASGSQGEAHLAFAGLHHLIYHHLDRAAELPVAQREALDTAFGRIRPGGIDPFLISLAVLELLGALAATSPLVVSIDDVQWIDTPTMDVINFVARRISDEPILILLSARPLAEGARLDSAIRRIDLEPLDPTSAAALLQRAAPDLNRASRQRILAAARGNPLALLELPLVTDHVGPQTAISDILPLTARLEEAFADRIRALPQETQDLLTIAAVDDGRDVGEIFAAAAILSGAQVPLRAMDPAVSSRLIRSDGSTLEFHHPLVRSAVYRTATLGVRRAAHDALARVLAADPDRSVWHRAALQTTPDESLAAQLEAAAQRSRQRGAVASAVQWFERAAALSPDPGARYSRLLSAAEVAFELGRFELVGQLRSRIYYQDLRPSDRSRLLWLNGVFNDGRPESPERITTMIELAKESAASGDTALALHLCVAASRMTWWADPGVEIRSAVVSAAESTDVPSSDLRMALTRVTAFPIETCHQSLETIGAWVAQAETPPDVLTQLGTIAFCAGDFLRAIDFFTAPIELLRARGQLSSLAHGLTLRAWAGLYVGSFDVARGNAEATRLSEETGQPRWAAMARVGDAAYSGLRTGQMATASLESAQDIALDGAIPMESLLAHMQFARGITHLSAGDFPSAYSALCRLFDESGPTQHRAASVWAVGYLAEAALFADRVREGRQILERLKPVYDQAPSMGVRVALDYARAVLATDETSEEYFRIAHSHCKNLPWHRARLHLARGSWLRRKRRPLDCRDDLRSARDAFEVLGMAAWAARADRELLASGERQRHVGPETWTALTAQEMQIAEMAAQGKTNREIGQMLYMSHRTVASHLYHIFPKLGINSRSQLGRLLASNERPLG
jgi:DNA-binding CsgD family transcriptional regulator/tetratricopeptide (TPR) repeat protein